MATAVYRVNVNGFRCRSQTWDDPLEGDGKGDEVFIRVNHRVYDNQGKPVTDSRDTESELMGDAFFFPNRIRAGSARGGLGGLVDGDHYPPIPRPFERDRALNSTQYPPYTVWEGSIADNEVVVLTPTIWEWDTGQGALETWLKWQVAVDAKYGEKAKETFGTIFPVARPFFGAISLGIQTIGSMSGLWDPLGANMSRPIGIQRDPNDPNGFRMDVTSIALNKKTVERMLVSNDQALGAGVVGLSFVDDPSSALRGAYDLYLQLEKVSGDGGAGGGSSLLEQDNWRWCSRCEGLFFGGGQPNSRCPEGGQHAAVSVSGSGDYVLQHNRPPTARFQDQWRWCPACQGLFFGPAVAGSRCPAGGTHVPPAVSGSGNYGLPHGVGMPPPSSLDRKPQRDWRWCPKCQGLYYGAHVSTSTCPAGSTHMPSNVSRSGEYTLTYKA